MLLEAAFLQGSCIPDAWTPWDAGEDAGLSALEGEEVTVKTQSSGQASGEPRSSVWGCGSCQELFQLRD